MAASILAPFAKLNTLLGTTVVHETLYPFLLAPTLHGARVSLAYRGISRRVRVGEAAAEAAVNEAKGKGKTSGKREEVMSVLQDLASFLTMVGVCAL